jgi:hypothetical protein
MFESFNETSRLYAQNFSVIEAVKNEFQRDVNAFLDSVYEEMQAATSGRVREKRTQGAYRYWWIGEGERDLYPQLWVDGSAVTIVDPGEVRLTAIAPKATPDQLRAFASVATKPEFSSVCGAGGTWSIFTTNIRYEDENPVHRVSRIAAGLVLALNEIYEKTSRTG